MQKKDNPKLYKATAYLVNGEVFFTRGVIDWKRGQVGKPSIISLLDGGEDIFFNSSVDWITIRRDWAGEAVRFVTSWLFD
jgi:hypothetical protein